MNRYSRLGFTWKVGKSPTSESYEKPDYYLSGTGSGENLAAALTYPWGRSLDGKDSERDKETPEENPNAAVVSLLEKGETPWAIVTNGKLWRLYSAKTHSRATNYYEIDLEEIMAATGTEETDLGDSFRYFWLFFRAQAFVLDETTREGETIKLSLLDRLLVESNDYAKELGERLKERVFTEVFPHLAAGFISYLRPGKGADTDLSSERFDQIFHGTLTLLYRLLFLFYAESRDLLPVKEVRGYYEASLTKIKQEIEGNASAILDEAEGLIKKAYKDNSYAFYDRLTKLFRIIDEGDTKLNVPTYNGGLFLSSPHPADHTMEADDARFLNEHKVPDRQLALALDLLSRDIDLKRQDLVFIDYKSLGVRQLGSIYEGLLEFKIRLGSKKLGLKKKKGKEVYVPFSELSDRQKSTAERTGKFVKKGQVYLENDKRERKATGSYYTPEHIVKYIVENAVGPVLGEKFEALRPKLREVQKQRIAFEAKQKGLEKAGLKPEPENKINLIGRDLVDELFDLKVLDPAMGSGHFLVQVVDFITDKTIDFLNAFPWNPIQNHLEKTRQTILSAMDEKDISIDSKRLTDVNLLKRHILKRCVYGVDLNPMAVELAKVSLWLDCFTLGAPLSFLDHHLRCGNSLIGVTVNEVQEVLEGKEGEHFQRALFGSRFAGLLLATDLMRHVGELTDVTSAQVKESRSEYAKATDALAPFKRILDVYASQWFGNGSKNKKEIPKAISFLRAYEEEAEAFINAKGQNELDKALKNLTPEDYEIARTVLQTVNEKRFFHWELEFPEVFFGPRKGTTQLIERLEGAGFDAVIGNPPYDVLEKDRLAKSDPHADLKSYVGTVREYSPAMGGKLNLFRFFLIKSIGLMRDAGRYGMIMPLSLTADISCANARKFLFEVTKNLAIDCFPQKDNAKKRIFETAKLSTAIYNLKKVSINRQNNYIITINVYPANNFDTIEKSCKIFYKDLLIIDPKSVPIPLVNELEWSILLKCYNTEGVKRLENISNILVNRGEINQTIFKKRITDNLKDIRLIKGAEIGQYREHSQMSQGEKEWFNEKDFNAAIRVQQLKNKVRIATQRITGIDETLRIIATIINPPAYFADSTNSILVNSDNGYSIEYILALLNSTLFQWRFRITSTNNNVGTNELNALPIKILISDQDKKYHKDIVRLVKQLLKMYKHPDNNTQQINSLINKIDTIIYNLYEIDQREIDTIEKIGAVPIS